MLTDSQARSFIEHGFVRIDAAFSRDIAAEGRAILWRDTGCNPDDPRTWTKPVIRLGQYGQPPFERAGNTPVLHRAFDRLVGKGRWLPRRALGTFVIRFPSVEEPADAGWHIDASYGVDANPNDFLAWRANIFSKDRALLMLFLFSDVTDTEAPTRIRSGSHLHIARRLAPAGEGGLSLRELAAHGFEDTADCPEVAATGPAGTVYLCHPFLVHAAQAHRGRGPRFLAQPPLSPAIPLCLQRPDADYSPVEQAIRLALAGAGKPGMRA
jgi:hypothetical protein